MTTIPIQLSEAEAAELRSVARDRGTTVEQLAAAWIGERLLHERERAAGRAWPMAPCARQAADRTADRASSPG